MVERPPLSRNQLEWYLFEQKESGDWVLNLAPPYYAEIFKEQEPSIMVKSNTGWRDSRFNKSKYAYFVNLSDAEIEQIKSFISDYKRLVILDINKNIKNHFSDELDACIALDYNFIVPKGVDKKESSLKHSEIGKLENLAKYNKFLGAIDSLIAFMANTIRRIPNYSSAVNRCLSYMPPDPKKDFHLPLILANNLALKIRDDLMVDENSPIIHVKLKCEKPQLKKISIIEKIEVWQRIFSEKLIQLSKSVHNIDVILIDDLYQSGVSIWTMAKYLKSQGARRVLGYVCVKTIRDTHNI